ncbi:MAG: hypothetical protein ABR532_01030 [Candidatus Dormibacteria bacterium]
MKQPGGVEPTTPAPPLGPLGGYWRVAIIGVLLVPTVALSALSDVPSLDAARAAVTLLFMAAGPGMALMGLLRLDDLLLEFSLALALSLVVETMIAMAMLLLKHWVPSVGLIALEIVTAIGAIVQVNQVNVLKQRTPYRPTATNRP